MVNFKVISVVALGISSILLPGCTSPFVKTADQACGPYPGPDEFSENVEIATLMGERSGFHEELARQPLAYIECRSARGDQDANYVIGIFTLNGIQVPQDYIKSAGYFFEAFYKASERATNIIYSGGEYAGIVDFETASERPGIPDAYYQMGKIYQEELIKGAEQEKIEWLFMVAATKGHKKAAEALEQIEVEKLKEEMK